MTIRNPIEWSIDQFRHAVLGFESAGRIGRRTLDTLHVLPPEVRRITLASLGDVLAKGIDDFTAFRTDVIFVCVFYPIAGLVLARLAFGYNLLHMVFPLVSGFALIGPFVAVGLNEMSRRREMGKEVSWADAFAVARSPSFGAIAILGLLLMGLFLLWLLAAWAIYAITLGPAPPVSVGSFARDVLTTNAGWIMIAAGVGIGFLFALLVLAISVVSFPLLLDREAGVDTAILTSVRAVVTNPVPMAGWGVIVAGGLFLGSIPLFLGLIFVMPVLGHATWHLYRKVVG